MDREAAVIREQISQTRAHLDQKLAQLEARARDLRPGRVARRYLPANAADRALGTMLLAIGLGLAWRAYRNGYGRRARMREAMASYGRW